MALTLDKDKEIENIEQKSGNENRWRGKSDSIEDLLKRYREKEDLRSTNRLECTKCEGLQDGEKNMELMEGPKILIMQLKRYQKKKEVNKSNVALPNSASVKLKQQ